MTPKKCDICGEEHFLEPLSCEACNKVVSKYQNDTRYSMDEVRKALKYAYSHKDKEKKESYFKCAYTGIISKFHGKNETLRTFEDALILTLDHKNTNSEELIVSLNIINKMKTDIPFEKFQDIIILLGEYFKNKNEINSRNLENALRNNHKMHSRINPEHPS